MRFHYCPDCGTKLIMKEIGDEGLMPYCPTCQKPWFDMFSTCVIVLVVRKDGQVALLQQNYISTRYRNLVSGYMKPGETAEESARREVEEEIGIRLNRLVSAGTCWFKPKELLMITFIGYAENEEFSLSGEVDSAEWVPAEQAEALIFPRSPYNATAFVLDRYLELRTLGSPTVL